MFSVLPLHSGILKINNSLINLLHADLHTRPFFLGNLNKRGWYPDWSEKDVLHLDCLLLRGKGNPSLVVDGMHVVPSTS